MGFVTVDKVVKNKIYTYSNETLKRSNFKSLKVNQIINLENHYYLVKVYRPFYTGHVDLYENQIIFIDKAWMINFKILDEKLKKFLIEKASISINGVSLTISKVSQNSFVITVIHIL